MFFMEGVAIKAFLEVHFIGKYNPLTYPGVRIESYSICPFSTCKIYYWERDAPENNKPY